MPPSRYDAHRLPLPATVAIRQPREAYGAGPGGARLAAGKGVDMASGEKFERHRQPWRQDEIQKLHLLAGKGMSVRAIAKALTRSEESVRDRAKADKLKISKLR